MTGPLESLARAIVAALAIGVAYAAFFAAFVAIAIRMTGASATSRHVLWWLALAASVAIPIVSIGSSLARLERRTVPIVRPVATVEREPATDEAPAHHGAVAPRAAIAASDAGFAFRRAIDTAVAYPHAGEAIVATWAFGALAGLISLGRGFAGLRAIKKNARPLDERVVRRLRRYRHRCKTGRVVALRVSDEIDVPVAAGFGEPAILIPARLVADRDAAAALVDLDQIVLHEYAHLERYDDWTNAMQLVFERIFWVDPFVAFFGGRIALAREIACDDWVVAQTGHAHRYATCLWKLVEASRLPSRRVAAPGALFSPRQITVRIEQLLDARRNALPRLSPASALVTGAIALALVAVQAARAPALAIDVLPAPLTTVAARPAAPAVAVTPRPAATFAPRMHATIVLHRIPVAATPDAIARAVAHVVEASTHAAVATTVTRLSSGPHAYADTIGIDMASKVSKAMVPLAPAIADAVVANVAESVADEMSSSAASGTARACSGCDLHGADLRGRDLHGVSWVDADLHGADLRNVDLRGANLSGVDLHGARLEGADLRGARLSECDLQGAMLAGARLDDTRLNDTNLGGATLDRTDLRNARLVDCDVTDAQLARADTRGAHVIRDWNAGTR